MIVQRRSQQTTTKMNIEKRILQIHNYTITPPKTESGRWQTYVKKGDEKRKIIRAKSYDEVLEKLFDFYFSGVSFSSLKMQDLFEEWIRYKEEITNSKSTIRRHEQHWNKYFNDWKKRKLRSFDRLELQKQCNQLVKNHNLSSKEWQNIKTILSGMFSYAYEKDYIKSNPMDRLKIRVKFRQVNKKTGKTETFQTDDYNCLLNHFEAQYTSTGDLAYLALKLDFYLGLRVGELSTLRWSDLIDLNHLHVVREEIKGTERTETGGWVDVYRVVDHTKTHTDRIVPLVPAAVAIINRIRLSNTHNLDDYIFTRNGSRITSRQITYCLEKSCETLVIPVKRTHKIRKTVASRLNAGGVPLDYIREFLGHSNTATTLSYIYNPLTEKETYNLIAKAL